MGFNRNTLISYTEAGLHGNNSTITYRCSRDEEEFDQMVIPSNAVPGVITGKCPDRARQEEDFITKPSFHQ